MPASRLFVRFRRFWIFTGSPDHRISGSPNQWISGSVGVLVPGTGFNGLGRRSFFRCQLAEARERTVAAEVGVAERLLRVAHGFTEAQQQAVVRDLSEVERLAGFPAESAADKYEGNIVSRVRVALSEFVGPDDGRVVQQRSVAARFRGL